MPGVPTGRGCNECRRQKKKCDQAKPKCSRCLRLDRPCVGSGVQRYQWKVSSSNPLEVTVVSKKLATARCRAPVRANNLLSLPPTNASTRLVAELVTHLAATDDVRYNMAWAYGTFLLDIPKRINANPALDAAVAALLSALYSFRLYGGTFVSPDALTNYSYALRALRSCLDHVASARQPETLCAITVLLICQGLLGYRGGCFMYGDAEGAAQVLLLRGRVEPRDGFERDVLLALRPPIILGGLTNPRIALDPEDFLKLIPADEFLTSLDHRVMHVVTHMPSLVRRCQALLSSRSRCLPSHPGADDPSLVILARECRSHYETMQQVSEAMGGRLIALKNMEPSRQVYQLIGVHQRTYGLALGVILHCNVVLRVIDSEPTKDLALQALQLVNALFALEPSLDRFRPLGTVFLAFSLAAAWAAVGTTHEALRTKVEQLYRKYTKEFYALHAGACPRRDLETVANRLWLNTTNG